MKLIELTKVCTKCDERKSFKEFSKHLKCRFKVSSRCKICEKTYSKNYNKINKNRKNLHNKKYYENNKDKKKAYAIKNKDNIKSYLKEYHKNYYKINKDKLRIYREGNKDKRKNYLKTHREEINKYERKKREKDHQFRLNKNISRSIRFSLKNGKGGKSWLKLVPYNLKQLTRHIEKQFQIGMTWENYGSEWHLDHKIPLSVHNFTKPEHSDFKKAWSLKNLQPLWAEDNLKKNAKLNKPFQPSLLL